jgi:uncharacterized protein YdhG (YjbR/CyaY superfamily)
MKKTTFSTVDEYIAQYPADIQKKLKGLRKTIRAAAPKAVERISYNMPTYSQQGNLVYFAVFKNHIGFYPIPSGIKKFEKELSVYKLGKGSAQFPIDKPLPLALIKKIVAFRVHENMVKMEAKQGKSKKT